MRLHTLLFLLVGAMAPGCNEAPLVRASDAGVPCQKPLLIYPCVAQEAGVGGCSPDLQSTESLGQDVVISPGSYEAGCGVQVNSTVLDGNNQCTQLGTCTCAQDGGAFNWVCFN